MMDRYNVRTDLALEQRERFVSDQIEIPGVAVEETYDDMCEVRVTTVRIETENGAAVMGKPVGNYITLEAPKMAEADESYHREISGKLMEVLEGCLPEKEDGQSILIIGLGNRNVTPDALGPLVVEHVSMDMAQNILVIKTVAGMAMAVAAAVDAMKWNEVVGCIAGDDTIMCAIRTVEDTAVVMENIRKLVSRKA